MVHFKGLQEEEEKIRGEKQRWGAEKEGEKEGKDWQEVRKGREEQGRSFGMNDKLESKRSGKQKGR